MASYVYPLAKQSFLSGTINLTSASVKVALLTSAYTYSATDQFRSALTGVIALSAAGLSGVSVAGGVFSASNLTFAAVASGSTIAALVGYIDTGNIATDNLIWFDGGFSQLTNGGDILASWDTGANKIFAL